MSNYNFERFLSDRTVMDQRSNECWINADEKCTRIHPVNKLVPEFFGFFCFFFWFLVLMALIGKMINTSKKQFRRRYIDVIVDTFYFIILWIVVGILFMFQHFYKTCFISEISIIKQIKKLQKNIIYLIIFLLLDNYTFQISCII